MHLWSLDMKIFGSLKENCQLFQLKVFRSHELPVSEFSPGFTFGQSNVYVEMMLK